MWKAWLCCWVTLCAGTVRRLPTEIVYKWTRMKMVEGKMVSKILCLRRCYEHRMSAQWCPCAAHGKTAAFGIVALFGPQVIMFSVLRFECSPFYVHIVGVPDCDVFVLVRSIMFTTESGAVVWPTQLHCGEFIIWLRPRLKTHRCDIGRLFLDAWPCRHARSGFSRCQPLDLLILSCHLQGSKECRRAHRLSTWKSRTLLVSIAPNSSVSNRTWKHTRRSVYTRLKASDVYNSSESITQLIFELLDSNL